MTSTMIQTETPERAHSRRFGILPLAERNLTDRLAGKKVLIVFCDSHFEDATKLVNEMTRHDYLPQGLSSMAWSEFKSQLPLLSADIVLIYSLPPYNLTEDPISLAASLKSFRENNPSSVVHMVSLYSTNSPPGLVFGLLERENLISIEPGPITYNVLLSNGASAHERKRPALEDAAPNS